MAVTSKILAARGRKQAEKLGIEPTRIPPGQYLTERFPVLTYGPNQAFDLQTWDLTVDGAVDAPFSLTWDELRQGVRTSDAVPGTGRRRCGSR
jgi:DMSO/TMAO reductase YedYZ molybdopterin-dependent catalytic subunit